MLTLMVVLVRLRSLVPEHIRNRLSVRRQREQSDGLLLQLRQVHSDRRKQSNHCGLRVSCPLRGPWYENTSSDSITVATSERVPARADLS